MNKLYPILLCLFIILAFKQDDPNSLVKVGRFVLPKGVTSKDYLPNTLIVKFKKSSSKQVNSIASVAKIQLNAKGVSIVSLKKLFPSNLKSVGTQSLAQSPLPDLSDLYVAQYEGGQSITDVINALLKDEQILYAEPSYIYKTSYVPNDPNYTNQSYLTKVQAPQAWDVLRDASSVILAIVDSGSDLQHEDLAANIYLNTADPVNGIDDDNDGYIDNYSGWDFVGNSASTMIPDNNPDVTSDTTDHGVHVSGIASAVSDNGRGVASIAFNAKLMIIKTGADNNGRSIYKGYEGIKYAADHGAKIINCSWGGPGGGQFGQEMVDYAVAKGSLIIAAAGNESDEEPSYPAAYKGVLSVASVTNADVKSGFSTYGYSVDISAPGTSIFNTRNDNKYGSLSGTSMATPMVASAAALVKVKYPNYNGLQIGEVLRTTADPIDALNPMHANKMGKGRLNVYKALTQPTSSVRYQQIAIADQSNGSRTAGSELTLSLDLKSFLTPVAGLTVDISSTSPYVQILNSSILVGSMGTLETKTNIGPVAVKILANTPQNQEVTFKINYSGNGGSYLDTEFYTITVALDYLNVTVNKTSTTFTSNGRVGFSKADATGGLGFIYRDEPMLFEAALMIGNSPTQVSNNARSEGNSSEDFVKLISAAKVSGSQAAFEWVATFTDEGASNPIGLKVKSKMFAYATAPDDKYVIVNYDITNTSSTTLQGVYTGMFTDWDLDESSANATRYDAATKTAYAFARENVDYPYAGVRLLTNSAPAAYYPMSYQLVGDPLADNKFTTAEKYQALSSGIKSTSLGTTGNGYDIMYTIGSGPYSIPANGTITVAYAFISGDNLSDLLNSGNAAQTKYETIQNKPTDPQPGDATAFLLKQNYPNPAKDFTTIPFSIAERSATKLTLTNVLGRVVQTLINETLNAGSYHVPVNLNKLPAGVYFYQLSAGGYQKALKMMVVK
ncbi:S8 family serine peptidase [Pedobacter insulae]|uniref:Por secretion system C-terminal sorting domain-containing protein n=1 Tax=Pedobacter insulae TaxID=414048 RepID=A0A1I2Y0E5_9SPHI|nr:S8 family serine peptidase [Pedobacter insulae]SFH19095.1 Por secretion system C-terminal sorting domain-containing protein [Pedobacter insulae]